MLLCRSNYWNLKKTFEQSAVTFSGWTSILTGHQFVWQDLTLDCPDVAKIAAEHLRSLLSKERLRGPINRDFVVPTCMLKGSVHHGMDKIAGVSCSRKIDTLTYSTETLSNASRCLPSA